MKCPYCRARNMAGAGFCIECGEPLDDRPVDDARAREDGEGNGASWSWREKRLELVIGVILLALVLGSAVYSYITQEAQGGHYRAGLAALQRGDLEVAATEMESAAGYLDSGTRAEAARQRSRVREDLYGQAVDALRAGRKWQAARLLAQVEGMSPGFRDTAALLEEARSNLGRIVYRLDSPAGGDGALYVARTDGSDAQPVPGTSRMSLPRAMSGDGKWLLYSEADWSGPDYRGTTFYLYSVESRATRLVVALPSSESDGANAGFTADDSGVLISTRFDDRVYALPTGNLTEGDTPRLVARGESAAANDRYPTLVLGNVNGSTALRVGDERGSSRATVALEPVQPDGALFSPDGRYLMYRLCGPVLGGGASGCALRLVDLRAPQPGPLTLGTLPNRRPDDRRNYLTGEFTRDGQHIFVLSHYEGETEAHLYDIATGRLSGVDAARTVEQGPLVSLLTPGVSYWQGPNSLTFTEGSVQAVAGRLPGGRDMPYYRVKSHWVEVGPGDRYVVYLEDDFTGGPGEYRLMALALARPTRAMQILQINTRQYDWRYTGYLLPEGHTFLTLMPPTPEAARGLYAYDLVTGGATLLVPDAVEMLEPGPRRYAIGDYLQQP